MIVEFEVADLRTYRTPFVGESQCPSLCAWSVLPGAVTVSIRVALERRRSHSTTTKLARSKTTAPPTAPPTTGPMMLFDGADFELLWVAEGDTVVDTDVEVDDAEDDECD